MKLHIFTLYAIFFLAKAQIEKFLINDKNINSDRNEKTYTLLFQNLSSFLDYFTNGGVGRDIQIDVKGREDLKNYEKNINIVLLDFQIIAK